ncbi:hypothetical protein ACFE04_008556 [Oxalis oulophora]
MNPVYLLSFVLILVVFPNGSLSHDLIAKACDQTLHKELCNSILISIPESMNADTRGLAKILLEEAVSNAWNIKAHVFEISKRHSSIDYLTRLCLKDTATNYVRAMNQINEAIEALDGKKYNEVKNLVKAAITNLDTCDDVYDPALATMTEVFTQICSIELDMTKLLVTN